jgi:hypothetical protein
MKTVGIYLNIDNRKHDQDAYIADLIDNCYEKEKENDYVIIDTYLDIDGKTHERERLRLDAENGVIKTVITNDESIDEFFIDFMLISQPPL